MHAKRVTVLIAYDSSKIAGHAIDEAARIFPGVGAVVLVVWPSVRSIAGAGRLGLPDDVIAAGVAGVDGAAAQ
jgi:hypothetical protein